MISSELSLTLQIACFALSVVHGWSFPRTASIQIGIFWGILGTVAFWAADGQGAVFGVLIYIPICWALGAAGSTLRRQFRPPITKTTNESASERL